MKKTLLVAALLAGFAGAASAQQAKSPLTLYGIVDVGYSSVKEGAGDRHSTVGQISGHQSGSRFGLKGSEDLGGGLKGIFNLEAGFDADTGDADSKLFGRQAWVGIAGGFGEIRLGRQEHVTSLLTSDIDPFGNAFGRAAIGTEFAFPTIRRQYDRVGNVIVMTPSLVGMSSSYFTPLAGDNDKVDNAIAYVSPNIGGLTVGVNYTTQMAGQEVAGAGNNTRWIGTAVNYTLGDLMLAASYDRMLNPNSDANGPFAQYEFPEDLDFYSVGASYNLGFVKLHAGYYNSEFAQNDSLGRASKDDQSSWLLGVSAPLGSSTNVMLSYKQGSADHTTGYGLVTSSGVTIREIVDTEATTYAVGLTYDFSKRTNLYATYAYSEVEGTSNFANVNYDKFKSDEMAIGVRHQF